MQGQGIVLLLIYCSFLKLCFSATSVFPFRDLNNRSSEKNTIYDNYVSSLLKKLQSWERAKKEYIERKHIVTRKKVNARLKEKLLKSHLTDTNELIKLLNEITSRVENFMISTNQSVPGSDSFSSQGHVYSKNLTTQIQYYLTLAKSIEDVNVVCETGFNAGHSAALWLSSMPQIVYFGVMPWTNISVSYISALFGDRFHYIRGYSTDTMTKDNMMKLTCDLLSVDGDHYSIYKDLVHGRNISSRTAYVVIDDYVSENNIPTQWHMAVKEGWLETLDEHKDKYVIHNSPTDFYHKGWVLGQFIPIPRYYMYEYNWNNRLVSRPIISTAEVVKVAPEPPAPMTVAKMDKVMRRMRRDRAGKSSSQVQAEEKAKNEELEK